MLRTEFVASADDPRLDAYRDLKDVQQRVRGHFVAESELVVERVLASGMRVSSMFLAENRARRLADALDRHAGAPTVYVAKQAVIDQVVGFPLHRGVLALVERPALPDLETVISRASRIVVLEDVVDPDNVGAIFRHAAAFSADAIILTEHSGDPLYRKALRTSMGHVLRVPYCRGGHGHSIAETLRSHGITSYSFTPAGDTDLRTIDVADRCALFLGAEHDGLRPETMSATDRRVRIPMRADVDSLNVATSAAIAMYELFR